MHARRRGTARWILEQRLIARRSWCDGEVDEAVRAYARVLAQREGDPEARCVLEEIRRTLVQIGGTDREFASFRRPLLRRLQRLLAGSRAGGLEPLPAAGGRLVSEPTLRPAQRTSGRESALAR